MGFFSNLTPSSKKASKLRELQLKISPPLQDLMASMRDSNSSDNERALEEYLDYCVADNDVQSVMNSEQLTRSNLKSIYDDLRSRGLGRGDGGQDEALSTIAYAEPLLYYVRAPKSGHTRLEVTTNLQNYWGGRLKSGDLLRLLQ